ncbi:dipeptidase [Bacillus manliponensis]|uniref:dipeptidase n=1 Tax=Bacillus manliponensis TaxID=574376 RepID=UPI003518468E
MQTGCFYTRGVKFVKVFDAHCDVLWQLWRTEGKRSFEHDEDLHISFEQLKKKKGSIQCFAIYVPEGVPYSQRFEAALEMANIFHEQVLRSSHMKWIQTKEDVHNLTNEEIGAILTLEGCEAVGKEISKLHTLYNLGVRSVGLTWNYANLVADGALETRGAGLSLFGKEVVSSLNHHRMWTDVSHLSEKGFWDVMEIGEYPIASHSNCYHLCPHPRNLKDEQIKALIKKDGMIGVTFVPGFLTKKQVASIDDILRHVEHICMLGGEKNVGFGSDFDGIVTMVKNIKKYEDYNRIIEVLLKYYTEAQVKNFTYNNFVNHILF